MNKVYIDLPEYTRRAVEENLPDFEIVSQPDASQPEKKVRIGVLIDKILREFGSSFEIGSIKFNTNSQTANKSGKSVKLTEKEIALISYLHINAGEAGEFISRQDILHNVWQYSQDADTRTVESHVHRLNQKFEEGFGFKLVSHKDNAYKIS